MRRESQGLSRRSIEQAIDNYVLNSRNRMIMKRRMIDGLTYEKIADEFGLSPQRIKQIVYNNEACVCSAAQKIDKT